MSRAGRAATVALLLATGASASTAAAQESVFNLGGFGIPGGAESVRARGLGGAGLGLGLDVFSLENPAAMAGFTRAGLYLSISGQRGSVEDASDSADLEDVWFPMGQFAIPAWNRFVLGAGYYQFLDFDAALESTVDLEGEPVPVGLETEGAVAVVAPTVARPLDPQTGVGVSVDFYMGSRETVRTIDVRDVESTAIATADTTTRDFRGLGVTVGIERRLGERARVAAAYRVRPTLESDLARGPGAADGDDGASEFDLPDEFIAGAAVALSSRILAAASVRYAGWEGLDGPTVDPDRLADALEVGGGIEWRPGERTAWLLGPEAPLRAGFRWRRLPLRLEGEPVTEWTASLGYGRGFGNRNRFDLVLETGRRGDLDAHGIAERFVRIGVGVAIFERWQRID